LPLLFELAPPLALDFDDDPQAVIARAAQERAATKPTKRRIAVLFRSVIIQIDTTA
jgi:hypothetical protein